MALAADNTQVAVDTLRDFLGYCEYEQSTPRPLSASPTPSNVG